MKLENIEEGELIETIAIISGLSCLSLSLSLSFSLTCNLPRFSQFV